MNRTNKLCTGAYKYDQKGERPYNRSNERMEI